MLAQALIGDAIDTQQSCETRLLIHTQGIVRGAIDARYSTMLLQAEVLVKSAVGKMEQNECKWSESEIYLVMIVTQLRDHLKEWCSNGKP